MIAFSITWRDFMAAGFQEGKLVAAMNIQISRGVCIKEGWPIARCVTVCCSNVLATPRQLSLISSADRLYP
jgi:hypothetical protein